MGYAKSDLTNRTAVVTGGTCGLGFELAKVLAQADTNMVHTGRRAKHSWKV